MSYSKLIQQVWDTVYDPDIPAKETIEKFFHPEFEQCINDEVMNRSQFIEHVLEQKQDMTVQKFEYAHMVENEGEVFAIYYPLATDRQGEVISAEVIAHFLFKENQIYRIKGRVELKSGMATN